LPSFIAAGFYTKKTPYDQEIIGLKRSCTAFGIHCHIKGYDNRGAWVKNAAIKPEFLLEMMDLHPNKKIVYLDADARVKQYPKLFDTLDADIAVHYRHGRELLSGTIFLSPNERTKRLLHAWVEQQKKEPEVWDQRVLEKLLAGWKHPLKVARLPAAYCQIFDTMKQHGDPIIEHMQASRRYKQLVTLGQTYQVPAVLHGAKVRLSTADGSYWLARPNQKAEQFLDKNCIRVPGTLRWMPRFTSNNRFEELKQYFSKQKCYIVGKGPSLDHLSAEHFQDGPVIALNEAIFKVEALGLKNKTYGLQQDAKLRASCLPKHSPILVSMKAANYYARAENVYIFQNIELGLNPNALSVSAAICLAKQLGAVALELLCFDACVNRELTYAKCIPYDSTWGGAPKRFLTHRAKIVKRAQGTPITWTIPRAPL
jgi:hypothetical protein